MYIGFKADDRCMSSELLDFSFERLTIQEGTSEIVLIFIFVLLNQCDKKLGDESVAEHMCACLLFEFCCFGKQQQLIRQSLSCEPLPTGFRYQ